MTDLVIGGGRRYHPQRSFRSIAIAIVLGVVCLLVVYFLFERMATYVEPDTSVADAPLALEGTLGSGSVPRLGFAGSSVTYAGNLAVLRLSGAPAALGAAHGRLLATELAAQHAALSPLLDHAVPEGGFLGRLTRDWRTRWRYRMLDDGIPGHQLVEMAHVLEGAAQTDDAPAYESFVRQQAALDLGHPAPWSSGAAFRAVTRATSFVAALRDPSGDRLLVGRTLALPGAADGGDAAAARPLVSFVRSPDVIPFASVGWPGLVGVVTGVNAEGIAVLVHPAHTTDMERVPAAQPATLVAREILENARSLDDAVAVLEHATPLGASSFLLIDGPERTWAVVERSPSAVAVRRDQPAVVTDIFTSDAFADNPENDRATRTRPAAMRAARADKLLRGRMAGPADALAILRDDRDDAGAPLPLGHRGALRDPSAVHTVLLDASTMVLWVADGPDAAGRFRAFDLRHELGDAPAAPPDDFPALSDEELAGARMVRRSRAILRRARQQASAGNVEQARELVMRALILTPDMPEVLLMAGDLARTAGDREAAEVYYRRVLAVGLDDLGAEEEIRALLGTH
jgi:isopenicillin-N N-acyltransferase-like protein